MSEGQTHARPAVSFGPDRAHGRAQLDNVLLQTQPDGRVAVKLCDFGYSKELSMWSACKTRCGTPEYVAPEVNPAFGER